MAPTEADPAPIPFHERYDRERKTSPDDGFRSDDNKVLRRIVAMVPKAGAAQAGPTKGAVSRSYASKIDVLSEPYVALNPERLGVMRIDIDRGFASLEHLVQDIRDTALLPHLPNIVISSAKEKTQIIRPHLLFLLPEDQEVWADFNHPRCRRRPVHLFRAVLRGITAKLLPIGADPGGVTNPCKIKNPLCVDEWKCDILDDRNFSPLREWSDWVDLGDWSADAPATLPDSSNNAFETYRHAAWRLAVELARSGRETELFGLDRSRLRERLLEFLTTEYVESSPRKRNDQRTAESVASYICNVVDPAIARRSGKIADPNDTRTATQRRADGGRAAAAARRRNTFDKLVEAVRSCEAEAPIRKSDLARIAKISRPTIDVHWAQLCKHFDDLGQIRKLHRPLGSTKKASIGSEASIKIQDDAHLVEEGDFWTHSLDSQKMFLPTSAGGIRRYKEDVLDPWDFADFADISPCCASGTGCLIEATVIEKTGFPPVAFACGEVRSHFNRGRSVIFAVRDWHRGDDGAPDEGQDS